MMHLAARRATLATLATLACLAALAVLPAAAHADVIYVDITRGFDFTGNGSLARPYQHITKGLAEALYGDTVMVSRGEYSVANGETLPLTLPRGVTLQGDTSPLMAPPDKLETVIYGNDTGPMMYITGGDQNTIVDGIAFWSNDTPSTGAAIYLVGGSAPGGGPQIRDCYFSGLQAPRGGAIYAYKSGAYSYCEPRIERCTFINCAADSDYGGAIYGYETEFWISDSIFVNCWAPDGGKGGAITLRGEGSTLITGSYFVGCQAPNGTGGAIDALGHSVGIFGSFFFNNESQYGAGIYHQDNGAGTPDALGVYNSVFAANTVSGTIPTGSAIRCFDGTARIVNCTVIENVGGSVIAQFNGTASVENSIVWNDDPTADDLLSSPGALTSSYSCIYDGDAGVGNISSDPRISSTGSGFRLLPTSPCIDKGRNASAIAVDIEDLPRIVDGDHNGSAIVDMGAYERNPRSDRAAGPNRYATAVEASEEHFDHAEKVVLATGATYPDALCAAPLAGLYRAPILLTPSNSLAPAVRDELVRLETEEIFVIGGTGAISESVVDELTAAGYRVERIAGANRYATSQAVAQKLADTLGPMLGDDFLVARGDAFPDALAVSPFAYQTDMPILLTPPDRLPAGFAAKVTDLGFTDAIVLGGTGAISEWVRGDIDILVPGPAMRVAGANRYETAVAFARFVDTDPAWTGMYSDEFIGLAIGSNFPDALCGGAVCGRQRGPLLLTGPTTLPASVRTYISEKSDTLAHVQAFGGTGVIGDSVLAEVDGLIP